MNKGGKEPSLVVRRRSFARVLAVAAGVLMAAAAVPLGQVPLVDQDSRHLTLDSLRGHVVVLNFIFTGCGTTCPAQTSELAQVQAALPKSVRAHTQFVSVSVDPLNDAPPVLKAFAISRGADLQDWAFLTGDPANIAIIERGVGAVAPSGGGAGAHMTDIRLLDADGRIVQRYAGVPVDCTRLGREISQLVALTMHHPAGAAP